MEEIDDPKFDKFLAILELERKRVFLEDELKSYLSDAKMSNERIELRTKIRLIIDRLNDLENGLENV